MQPTCTFRPPKSATNSDLMEDIQGPPTSGTGILPPCIPEDHEVHHQSTPSLSTKGSEVKYLSAFLYPARTMLMVYNLISRTSASDCAGSARGFKIVASENNLKLREAPKEDEYLEYLRRHIHFPYLDSDQGYPDLLKAVDKIDDGFQKYSHLSGPADRYNLMEVKHGILHYVRGFKRLQTYNSPRKEVESRPAIDYLVSMAFCHRLNAQHIFECEAELFLPAEPFTATADIATFLLMPDEWSIALTELNRHHDHAFCALTTKDHLLTFAVEAKSKSSARDTSSHQLAFCLCSAQHQRRALGYTNHTIYGLSSVGHTATLFVSSWVQNTVAITPTRHKFDLSSFSQHLELFVILCKLAEKFEEQFEEMKAQRNNLSILEKNKKAADNPWRLPFKPTKPGEKLAGSTRTMSREFSDGMTSDSERDSDLFEEEFLRGSFETSKSFVTSENDNYNESRIPLKAELLQQYIPTETTALPPAKDIATWAQHIADEVDGRDTIP